MDKKKLAIDAAVGAVAGMIGYQTGKFVKKKKAVRESENKAEDSIQTRFL